MVTPIHKYGESGNAQSLYSVYVKLGNSLARDQINVKASRWERAPKRILGWVAGGGFGWIFSWSVCLLAGSSFAVCDFLLDIGWLRLVFLFVVELFFRWFYGMCGTVNQSMVIGIMIKSIESFECWTRLGLNKLTILSNEVWKKIRSMKLFRW